MRLRDVFHQSQPEPCPGNQVGVCRSNTIELFENAGLVVRGDTNTVIGNGDDRISVVAAAAQVDLPRASGILHGVGQEVQDRLFERVGVRGH